MQNNNSALTILEVNLCDSNGIPLKGEEPIKITKSMLDAATGHAIKTDPNWQNKSLLEIVELWITYILNQYVEELKNNSQLINK